MCIVFKVISLDETLKILYIINMKNVNPRNLQTVLKNLATIMQNEDKESQQVFCEDFNQFLNDLLDQDFFGTEGQNDPRGDHRE